MKPLLLAMPGLEENIPMQLSLLQEWILFYLKPIEFFYWGVFFSIILILFFRFIFLPLWNKK